MRSRLLLGTMLMTGCSIAPEQASGPPLDTNQIEKLSTPAVSVEEDPQAGARLMPLTPSDLQTAQASAQGCSFRSNGALLLATWGSDSIARIDGSIIHLVHSSPVGPSGGFFEDRQVSISVGRTQAGTFDSRVGAPARATITNRRTHAQVELTGAWACRI